MGIKAVDKCRNGKPKEKKKKKTPFSSGNHNMY
jgi:hypothetical protein